MAVDKRNVVISAIVLEIEGREDITLDVSTPDSRKKLSEHPIKIKEGAIYQMKIVFRVRFDVITGLKYLEEKKRRGVLIEKSDTLMGSYAPVLEGQPDFEVTFGGEEAPSGMGVFGRYDVTSSFADGRNNYLDVQWAYEVTEDW
ncbi:Rho-GDP dissociation inhibitor [Penicillium maclennaniae]|uniref:Rho-GDP dissociation inhibitor n=1 Tax=Penicillium maclennaniae TaxID=1343394 RepID=UPI0025417D4B|nr:Rho-GDP dissociation inhibitor [Penicillium maclennaniae]KAJ5681412.1 Rho-GDP dissociation inhibitor [Penicillium maclennaniae]